MNGPRRTPLHNPNADALTVFGLLLIVVLVVAGGWAAAELAHLAEHTAAPEHNPVGWVRALVKGAWHWPRVPPGGRPAKPPWYWPWPWSSPYR